MIKRKWKVRYTDLETMRARRPFYNHEDIVEAYNRIQAIQEVQARFAPPRYGRFSASPLPVQVAEIWR